MSKKFNVARSAKSVSLSILAATWMAVIFFSCKKADVSQGNLSNASHIAGTMKGMDLQTIADNFVSPVFVVEPPDGSHRLFVVDQVGQIWIINHGQKMAQPFIDIASKMVSLSPFYDERGLLGLAFH